jgi:hypothetical protein
MGFIMNWWFKFFSPICSVGGVVLSTTALLAQTAIAPEIVASQPTRLVAMDISAVSLPPLPEPFPTLSTPQIDRQLALYLRYVAENGRPDILIVGSSRALQGVDPEALHKSLAAAGYPNLRVFNFGINGATAQVVKLLIEELLTPSQMPRVIVWADGARAFNSGRADRTYEKITTSPGYQKLRSGEFPQLVPYLPEASEDIVTSTDRRVLMGLNVVTEAFVPEPYFTRFAKVNGRYDGDYRQFELEGRQTQALEDLLKTTRSRKVPVVFVNLPLTNLYLDRARLEYEREFRRYNQRFADRGQLTFFDLGRKWVDRYDYFADPSHLNQAGAQAVSQELGVQMADYFAKRLGMAKQEGS